VETEALTHEVGDGRKGVLIVPSGCADGNEPCTTPRPRDGSKYTGTVSTIQVPLSSNPWGKIRLRGAERQRQGTLDSGSTILKHEHPDRTVVYNIEKEEEKGNDTGVGHTKSFVVDEAGLPRTTRHLFQRLDLDVAQLDSSWSDFEVHAGRIDGRVFHFLGT